MVPFSAIWLGLALWLGARYRRLQREEPEPGEKRPHPTAAPV
jgi:hypothetical protein